MRIQNTGLFLIFILLCPVLLYNTQSANHSKPNYCEEKLWPSSPNNSSWIINLANNSWHLEAITTDALENVYVAGIIAPIFEWYARDIDALFIIKFNKNGINEWTLTNLTGINEQYDYYYYDLKIDLNNNIYSLWQISHGDIRESLVIKLNSSGNLLWNRTFKDNFYDIYIDKQENVYLFGNEYNYLENSRSLLRLNKSGLLEYNYSISIDSGIFPYVLMVDELNQTYVASIKYNNYDYYCLLRINSSYEIDLIKDFDELDMVSTEIFFDDLRNLYFFGLDNSGLTGIFRYNISSNQLFNITLRRTYSSLYLRIGNLAIDSSDNIYWAGSVDIHTIVDFSEVFLFKFAKNGTLMRSCIWKTYHYASCNDLHVDSNYNIYFIGDSEVGPYIVKNPVLSEFLIDVFYPYVDEEVLATILMISSIFGVWCLLGIALYIYLFKKKIQIKKETPVKIKTPQIQKTPLIRKIKDKRTTYMKTFPYICDNCREFTYAFREYCENCGAKDTIRDAVAEDYEKK